MPARFKAKTSEAFIIKVLAELLTHNLKNGCFEIDDSGISLRQMDNNRRTLVDLQLLAENFSIYKFRSDDKISMGINLNHFHRMLKTIKKKDSMQFLINKDDPNQLSIIAIPKENARITTSCIRIQNTQSIDIDLPEGYGKPVIVNSGEFQKTCTFEVTCWKMIHIFSSKKSAKVRNTSRTIFFGTSKFH